MKATDLFPIQEEPNKAINYTLNPDQQKAAEAFLEFLLTDEKEMIICGAAGYGKTHLMGYMIDEVLNRYQQMCQLMGTESEFRSVVMTATTNPAAEVLGRATHRPCETIHSFMNLKVEEDFGTGQTRLKKNRNWTVHQNLIIFIDEAPMIDTPLLNHILEGTCNCKIIYVGDQDQLGPVKEAVSPIYSRNLRTCELTIPMRTGITALQSLNNQLKDQVRTGEPGVIQAVPGIIDWFEGDDMAYSVDQAFATLGHNNKIMAYTNEQVLAYNSYIRDIRNLPKLYTVGEILVNNGVYANGTRKLNTQEAVTVIRAEAATTQFPIDSDVSLEVQNVTVVDRFGNELNNMYIPMDKDHYKQLIKYYAGQKNWERYFYLKSAFPDLREADASTVHKAQGGSYDVVFLDLDNISTCKRADIVARMLYVGCSRARQRVILYGDLDPRFGKLQK